MCYLSHDSYSSSKIIAGLSQTLQKEPMARKEIPPEFVLGAATAAYSIEGAVREEGRGASIWDFFSHTEGKIEDGYNGDTASNHYERSREDVELMRQMGLKSYRFSIAWSRIYPKGSGQLNQRGLDFYARLVDMLLAANITPYITLHNWDLPQALQERGGWAERYTIEAFAEYAYNMGLRLGDRVKFWFTHDDPHSLAFRGHFEGTHAPGKKSLRTAVQVSHNLLVSHGRAIGGLRAAYSDLKVGLALTLAPVIPASDSAQDDEMAQRYDGYLNRWFLNPLSGKGYPADMLELYGDTKPEMDAAELREIASPMDFWGINYFGPEYVRGVSSRVHSLEFQPLRGAELAKMNLEITDAGQAADPEAMLTLLKRIKQDYNPVQLFITNGAAFPDSPQEGVVRDHRRTNYIYEHLLATTMAIEAGVPVKGYFVRSLLDGFEWEKGYSQRYGLIYTDFENLTRTPKSSAYWFSNTIAENMLTSPKEE